MAKVNVVPSRAWFGAFLYFLALAVTTACEDKIPTNLVTGNETITTTRRVVGVALLTFHDLNSPAISATIVAAPSLAELEQLRASRAALTTLTTIQLEPITVGEFVLTPPEGPDTRHIHATFGLRNTQTGNVVFDQARENLTFVAVGTALTIAGTPIRELLKADGTSASDALAQQVAPTALVALDAKGQLVTVDARTLRTLTAADSTNTTRFTGIDRLFPFGFIVLRPPVVLGLPASPFAGVVTLAFRLPELTPAADNATTLSVLFLIVDDTTAQPH
jgi:hypothetical protein